MHLTAIIRPYCSDNRDLDEMEMDMMQIDPKPIGQGRITAIDGSGSRSREMRLLKGIR